MSLFEFIASLYAVIAGLGVTLLVRSIGQLLESRSHVVFYWVHSSWLGFIFLLHVNSWFTLWSYRELNHWTVAQFLVLVSVPILLYLAAHVSVPEIPGEPDRRYDLRAYYYERHRLLLGLLALSVAANLGTEYLLVDHDMFTRDNGIRLGGFALLAAGAVTRRPWVHVLITLAVFAIVVWAVGFVGRPIE